MAKDQVPLNGSRSYKAYNQSQTWTPGIAADQLKSTQLYNAFMQQDIQAFRAKEAAEKLATGLKYDADKPRMDLLDPEFLEGVAQVLTFGANKYSANNWRSGIAYSRLIAAAYRHLGAINKGQDLDPETHLQHAYHAACCMMFLSYMIKHRKDLDDRYPSPNN